MMNRPRAIAAMALPVVLLLAACSSSGGATAAPSQAAPSVAAPSTEASAPASAAASAAAASLAASGGTAESYPLAVATAASGTYLTRQDGKALYVFARDTANSGKSACGAGVCSDNWPAYKADDLDEVKADASATGKLSIVTRDDGSKQLAYNGMPLYYYAGDSAAGDTNGKAIKNWSLATP